MTRRKAFTLTELFISILVLGIISSAIVISPNISAQTAQREAERVRNYIYRQIQMADRMHRNFNLSTGILNKEEQAVMIDWSGGMEHDDISFRASPGCSYSNNFNGTELQYVVRNRKFNGGGTITIRDSENKAYYVIIAVTEGRIRISDTPPETH